MRFGAHLSVSKGYEATVQYALDVGCECMQVFAKSPRQWRGKPLDADAAAEFISLRQARGTGPLFTHTAYLINLATTDDELRTKSVNALADEIVRGALLGAEGVVTHLGNAPDDDPEAAARRVAESILASFELAGSAADQTRLLLENTAGAGHTFGSTFEEIASIIDIADVLPSRLGVCFDTCHGWAWGMAVDSAEGWTALVAEIRETVGLERLGLIHANDCMFMRGSKRDRHAWIGDGHIGHDGFSAMVCMEELADICVVTEMPGELPDKDVENIRRLRLMRDSCA